MSHWILKTQILSIHVFNCYAYLPINGDSKMVFWFSLSSSKENFLLKCKQVLLTRFTKCTTSQNTFQSFPTSLHGFIVMILIWFHIDIHVHPMESELWVQNCCKEIHFVTKRLFLGIFRGWGHLAVQEDSFEPPLQRCQQCHYQRLAVAALISSLPQMTAKVKDGWDNHTQCHYLVTWNWRSEF